MSACPEQATQKPSKAVRNATVRLLILRIERSIKCKNPYRIAFTFDERNSGWLPLKWSVPQTPETTELMTDLPRNTHVIVNVTLMPEVPVQFTIDYTICPWTEHEINIPEFN